MSTSQVSFHIAGGQIIDPNGQPFIAKGINLYWDQLNSVVGNGTNMALTNYFPGINMVRVNYESSGWQDPSTIAAAVQTLTAKGIVVEIEDHTGISAAPYTGSQLAAEQAWYSTLATTFKNNPYVWFGTFNEPGNGTNLAGIAAQEVATYNTIRAAGNNNPILMEEPSGGNPGLVGADAAGYDGAGPMPPSDYAKMTNIVWDLHYYGWVSKYSTNQSTVSADLAGSASGASGIAGAQTITSADGTVPVIIGEFGNSTTGGAIDPNGDQVIQAVAASGRGFVAWGWNPGGQGDQLTTNSGQLTAYGQQIAAMIGGNPATPPSTTPTPTSTPTSPTSANEITTTSGGTLTDAAGNKWTLTSGGVIDENGAPIPNGAGTSAFAIVNNVIYGQDAASKSWFTYSLTNQTWTSSAAPNLTATPTATPAPTPTPAPTHTPAPTPTPTTTSNEITTSSGGTLTDAAGNKWTLTSAGVVDENGTAVPGGTGTFALAIVNNVIFGQDAGSKSWFTYSVTSQTWAGSTAPNLTATPTPTPAPTPTPTPTAAPTANELTTASGGTLTDAAGNKWTLTSAGIVDENGTAVPGGNGTFALAIVNNVIFGQDAGSKSWFTYSPSSQTWTSSVAPNLTTTPTPTASASNTIVKLGSTAVIIDAGNNRWGITAGGQVAVNGVADVTTKNVTELAYVGGTVWEENASGLWWGKTSPAASWSPNAGTATSPLPSTVTIAATQTSATVAWNQVSINAASGNHTVFISGTGDTANLSGGINTITDTGSGNTYVIPAASKGFDSFTTNVLTNGDKLDLRTALAATNWNGSASILGAYLSVTNGSQGAVLSIAPTSGGTATGIASIGGASGVTLSSLLAHALT